MKLRNYRNCHIGHCTYTSKSTDVKYIRVNAEASDLGTINSSDRIAATLCSLGTWFVSGIKEIISLPIIIIII
jgi:hypothetical protein